MDFDFIIKLLAYFIIYSFLGWVLESIVKTWIEKKPVNSGFLHGPLCPIYGFGAIIMFLFLNNLKGKYFLLFVVAFFILSVWEYFVGWLLEKLFHTTYWDYTPNKFNIKGRVCLMNSTFWGILGVVFVEWIHPLIDTQLSSIPMKVLVGCVIAAYLILLVDAIISIIKVKGFENSLQKISELGEAIKEKLEELASNGEEHKLGNKESIQKAIEELKQRQERLTKRVYRHTLRLKKAFPTMQSEKITEFLNNKLDSIKNRTKNKEK